MKRTLIANKGKVQKGVDVFGTVHYFVIDLFHAFMIVVQTQPNSLMCTQTFGLH